MKNILLGGFSLICLACVAGIALILYDVVSTGLESALAGYGVVALFIMVVAFFARYLWDQRQVKR